MKKEKKERPIRRSEIRRQKRTRFKNDKEIKAEKKKMKIIKKERPIRRKKLEDLTE